MMSQSMVRGLAPLDWLLGLEPFGIKLGLDNIRALVHELGHPERAFKSVHVAGTNGKGSVTAMVDAVLGAAGHRSARYTSPHLRDLTERFVVDGHPIDREALISRVADLRDVVERLRARGRLQAQPTFFEVTTAVAFELFRRAGTKIAVYEVGLGGRLDATSVLQPIVTAITTIGFDHQEHLGYTLGEIAFEKAGIIKDGTPVVVGRLPAEALDTVTAVASKRGARVIRAVDDVVALRTTSNRVRLRTPVRDYGDVQLALAGSHQIDNASVAVRLLETASEAGVPISPAAIVEGLARVVWPGRLESRQLPDGREALLDVAHNPYGAAALAAFLEASADRTRPLVFAAMRDKDATTMLQALAPVVGAVVLTRTSNPRSTDPSELAERARTVAPHLAIIVEPSPRDAVAAAWRISSRIVVAGSIFLVGDVMNEIDGP